MCGVSASRPRTALVVSGDAARRQDWGRELAREGLHVVRCAARACPLLAGEPCELLAGAQAAIYDEETVSSELFLGLMRTRSRPTVLFARDLQVDGQHRARFTRVLDHRGAATIFPHLR
jgi:hypothetical protein